MVNLQDIYKAQAKIAPYINKTPILPVNNLKIANNNKLFLKAEHLQTTGSFKLRGAANKVLSKVEQGARYVTTASSGNHGQAVAYIANELNVPATIVVPTNVNPSKENEIRRYNGIIEKRGTMSSERLPFAEEIAKQKNGIYIPPYDDRLIIAGQGTVGLEIVKEFNDVDVIVVPVGGGGLLSGILRAVKEVNPKIKVIGVEPETANDTLLSLENGKITSIAATNTIADGLRTSEPGILPFEIIKKYVDDFVLVSEAEIRQAFFTTLEVTKQLIEPSSATAIAAVMFDKLGVKNKNIVAVISGGNVNVSTITELFPHSN